MLTDLQAMFRNPAVNDQNATVLCCKKADAASVSRTHLDKLPEPDVVFFGVDEHGQHRHVNTDDNVMDDCRWQSCEHATVEL